MSYTSNDLKRFDVLYKNHELAKHKTNPSYILGFDKVEGLDGKEKT